MKKNYNNYIKYGIAALVIMGFVFGIGSFFGPQAPMAGVHSTEAKSAEQSVSSFSSPKMTSFDIALAKRNMDKDGDGKCDVCGMDIDMCISSGMLECTMDPNAKIGLLDSAHIHADFKVYDKGQAIDFSQEKYFVKSKFIHVEEEENLQETGNVLHIHATGVPLNMFFESIGLNLDFPRLFVNGEEKNFAIYAPKNQDKVLVTTSNDHLIKQELSSITDYAKNH